MTGEMRAPAPPVGDLAKRAQALLQLTGWRFAEVTVNAETGYARVALVRVDGGRMYRVTLCRSAHGGAVAERREVGWHKSGFYRDGWDFSESALLGTGRHEDWRRASQHLAQYIGDNAAQGTSLDDLGQSLYKLLVE